MNQKITSKINARIILSTTMTNILYSDYKINYDKSNKDLVEFFNELERNNLLQVFKGGEINISLTGSGFFKWDVFKKKEYPFLENDIIILRWIDQNEGISAWINSREMFAGVSFSNLLSSGYTLPFYIYEITTKNYSEILNLGSIEGGQKIPFWFHEVETPELLKCYNYKRREHNYNRMSLVEVFNKNFVLGGNAYQTDMEEFNKADLIEIKNPGEFGKKALNVNNWKEKLSDNYPVRDLEDEINNVLEYFLSEMSVNRTKILSNGFSSQVINQGLEIEKFLSQNNPLEFLQLNELRRTNPSRYQNEKDKLISKYGISNQEYYLMNSFIEISNGQNVVVEKMQSTFNGAEILDTINALFTMYFDGAGIDYSIAKAAGVYMNSLTSNLSYKKTIETIKMKKQLRERAINKMIRDIMYVWFDKDEKKLESFEGLWKFEIISNLVNDEYSDINRIISLKQNDLISKKRAINLAAPYLSDKELEDEMNSIEEDKLKDIAIESAMDPFNNKPQDNNPQEEEEEDKPTQEERAIQNKDAKSNTKLNGDA